MGLPFHHIASLSETESTVVRCSIQCIIQRIITLDCLRSIDCGGVNLQIDKKNSSKLIAQVLTASFGIPCITFLENEIKVSLS